MVNPSCNVDTDPDSILSISNNSQVSLARKLTDVENLFPNRKGMNILFTSFIMDNNTSAYTLTHTSSPSLNIAVFRSGGNDVVAHEIGHMFQLPHVGIGLLNLPNLMCGPTGDVLDNFFPSFCSPDTANELTSKQWSTARDGASSLW